MNFEFTKVNKQDSLKKLIDSLPSIALAFNDGLIIGQILTYTKGASNGNHNTFFRGRLEESGAITGLFKNLDKGALRRFLKLDLEYKYFIDQPKSTWAFRAFGGYGICVWKRGGFRFTGKQPAVLQKLILQEGHIVCGPGRVRGLGLGSLGIPRHFSVAKSSPPVWRSEAGRKC